MNSLTIPPPDELQRRIAACEAELKALRRMLRLADAAEQAEQARQRRLSPVTRGEGRPDAR
jgi:hypothetical protein